MLAAFTMANTVKECRTIHNSLSSSSFRLHIAVAPVILFSLSTASPVSPHGFFPRFIRDILEARTRNVSGYIIFISMPVSHTIRPLPIPIRKFSLAIATSSSVSLPAKVVDRHPRRRSARSHRVLSALASRLFRTWRVAMHFRMQYSNIHIDSVADFTRLAEIE